MPWVQKRLECRRALYSAISRSDKKRVPVAEIHKACISKRNRAGITTWFFQQSMVKNSGQILICTRFGFFFPVPRNERSQSGLTLMGELLSEVFLVPLREDREFSEQSRPLHERRKEVTTGQDDQRRHVNGGGEYRDVGRRTRIGRRRQHQHSIEPKQESRGKDRGGGRSEQQGLGGHILPGQGSRGHQLPGHGV